MKKRVLIIVGPTASGKSNVAVEFAKQMNGEIISCDSMQIYKKMNIGTAKISSQEMQNIPHHNLSIIDPKDEYSVALFHENTLTLIDEILKKNKLPIIVGGTGLFVQGLIRGYNYASTTKNENLRLELEQRADDEGLDSLYSEFVSINKSMAEKIKPTDKKRIIRGLEITLSNGKIMQNKTSKYDFLVVAPIIDRNILYDRINVRVDKMIKDGLIDEAKALYENGINESYQSAKGIGYKELFPYFRNEISLEQAVEKIKQHTRNYAKRQMTWFRGMPEVNWLEPFNTESIKTMWEKNNDK